MAKQEAEAKAPATRLDAVEKRLDEIDGELAKLHKQRIAGGFTVPKPLGMKISTLKTEAAALLTEREKLLKVKDVKVGPLPDVSKLDMPELARIISEAKVKRNALRDRGENMGAVNALLAHLDKRRIELQKKS